QVDQDHIFFLASEGQPNRAAVFDCTRKDGDWSTTGKPILRPGNSTEWDSKGIGWISVLPPTEINGKWRIWYIALGNENISRIRLATSSDGLNWIKSA